MLTRTLTLRLFVEFRTMQRTRIDSTKQPSFIATQKNTHQLWNRTVVLRIEMRTVRVSQSKIKSWAQPQLQGRNIYLSW